MDKAITLRIPTRCTIPSSAGVGVQGFAHNGESKTHKCTRITIKDKTMDRLEIERAIDLTETMCGLNIEGPNRKISMFLSLRQHLVDTLAHLDEVCSAYSIVLDHATGGQMSRPYLDAKMVCSIIDDAQNEHANTYISEAVEPYKNQIIELETDKQRLIEHAAILSVAIRDDDTDSPTEHWRTIPDHLQAAINVSEERLDSQLS